MKKKLLLLCAIIMLLVSIFAIKNITLATNNTATENNVVVKQKIGEKENWKHKFELSKYDENGKLIVYEIDEENVPENYTKKIDGNTITNTLNKHNYKVEYYYDGKLDESKTETINTWYGSTINTYTDKNKYGFKFEKTEGLGLVVGTNEKSNIIKVYYITDRCNLVGSKTWKDDNNSLGLRPNSYCLKLFADGEYLKEQNFTGEIWKFVDLQKYNYKTGKEIIYTIQEDEIVLENGDRYVPYINGTEVINTLTGTTQIDVNKVWEDSENANHTRPDNVQVIIRKILNK